MANITVDDWMASGTEQWVYWNAATIANSMGVFSLIFLLREAFVVKNPGMKSMSVKAGSMLLLGDVVFIACFWVSDATHLAEPTSVRIFSRIPSTSFQ